VPDARLILLHGAVERAALFDAVLPFLDGFDVVAPDRAGHGDRWAEGPGTIAGDIRDVVALLDEGPATVVGHSIGGLAAMGAALARPDLVRGIGLYETAVPWADWWTDDGRDAMLRETEANVAAADGIDPTNPARDRLRMAWATCLQEVRDAFGAPFAWQELTVPVTTGYGGEGTRPSARDAALVAAHYGVEPVVLAGAGHRAPKTDPDAFAAFVRRCDRPPARAGGGA
jgi:pimeloyl-ACP methyl ester carboxylesterase